MLSSLVETYIILSIWLEYLILNKFVKKYPSFLFYFIFFLKKIIIFEIFYFSILKTKVVYFFLDWAGRRFKHANWEYETL